MPLIVHCPNGCVIRVPMARAGTNVRCTECKSVIQLRKLTQAELAGTHPVKLHATLVTKLAGEREGHVGSHRESSDDITSTHDPESPFKEMSGDVPIHNPFLPTHSRQVSEDELPKIQTHESDATADRIDHFELPVPQPAVLRQSHGRPKRPRAEAIHHAPREPVDAAEIDVGISRAHAVADFEGINIDEDGFEDRAEDEFRLLSQFFAVCIGVLGLVLIVPSALAWSGWTALPVEPLGSRWIFIMIFLGALHIVYAIFLFQIQDLAALWSVSIFLLFVGSVHGVFTAGTWLDQGIGPVSRFLQLPPSETAAVTLWCFLHLCFSILLSYLCGRQAMRWKQQLQRAANPAG